MENEEEVITQETDTETTENQEVEVEQEVEQEDVNELKKKLATLEAQKEHWRKKATEPKATETGHSLADLRAIASVHEDDVERVERFAQSEGVSIKDALKNPELKAILNLREEQRNTAAATNVSPARRGATKISDEVLIANASAGKLPDSDEEINRLVQAKMQKK